MTTLSASLREHNEKLFQEKHPDILKALNHLGEPISDLVFQGDKVVNINIDGKELYPEDFETSSKKQVEEYFSNPDRIGFSNPAHCNLSTISNKLLDDLKDFFDRNEDISLSHYPETNIGYTFIFGIGLGGHLKEILKRSKGLNVVLIEPIPELITQSFSAIDWGEIFDLAEQNGTEISFILTSIPQNIVHSITLSIRRSMNTFLDGSYAYIHYPSWAILEARKLLNVDIEHHYVSMGFFEDEVLMMTNTYGNFRKHEFSILSRTRFLEQHRPVFIVASGPSIDDSLAKVIELRDQVILVSSGSSSLDILLKNDLIPDFHIETENSHPLVINLRKLDEKYDISGITFIGSTTVNPEVGNIFKKKWYYYRPQFSSAYILNAGTVGLLCADPLVANAAFSAMLTLGFKNIYLLGVDCGKRRDHGHHSKQAVYYQDDYDNYLDGFAKEKLDEGFNIVVPGNFGGEALTTKLFNTSRFSFKFAHRTRTANLYNCSNGAELEGIKPLSPLAIKLEANSPSREKTLKTLDEQMPQYGKGEYLSKIDLSDAVKNCDYLEQVFLDAYKKLLEDDIDFAKFEKYIIESRYLESGMPNPAFVICQGSMMSMIRLGAFFGTRIKDEENRKKYIAFFAKEYKENCLWMFSETKKMLTEMAEGREELSEIGGVKKQLEA